MVSYKGRQTTYLGDVVVGKIRVIKDTDTVRMLADPRRMGVLGDKVVVTAGKDVVTEEEVLVGMSFPLS